MSASYLAFIRLLLAGQARLVINGGVLVDVFVLLEGGGGLLLGPRLPELVVVEALTAHVVGEVDERNWREFRGKRVTIFLLRDADIPAKKRRLINPF